MFFIVAATISGGMTAAAWTLQYGIGWAVVYGFLAATASGAQATMVLDAIERREAREPLEPGRHDEVGPPSGLSRKPSEPG